MESPRNKMIKTSEEVTKKVSAKTASEDRTIEPEQPENKRFWFPTHQVTVEASSQEEAEKKLKDIISKKKEK